MAKKLTEKFLSDGTINPEYLEELKQKTLIQSTASSLRLSGIKVTEKEVEQIVRPTANAAFHKNIEKILSVKQLAVLKYLQNVNEATPKEIAEKTDVARATVSQALDKLLRFKKVERIGLGRSTRYRKI